MDQNPCHPAPRQSRQGVADRLAARGAALDPFDIQAFGAVPVIGMPDQHRRHTGKSVQTVRHHRSSRQHLPLFGDGPPRAQAAPCGHNDGNCRHICSLCLALDEPCIGVAVRRDNLSPNAAYNLIIA